MSDPSHPFLRFSWGDRLWSTGRIALSAGHLGIRRLIGLEGEEDAHLGEELARELDHMKGMAMKVGQILSYFDGVLPEETHAALRRLQVGAAAMPFDRVQRVIRDAFGRSTGELFDSFGRDPVASASVGQVHRARLGDREVAVKIQYPGILESIKADFRRLRGIGKAVTFLPIAVDGNAIVAELRDRVVLECDYLKEAESQDLFRRILASDPVLQVPAVHDDRTCETVITSDWVDGADLYHLARDASADVRRAVAMALLRFAYGSFYRFGIVNADPHPGNYLFPASGRIVLLDFGCTRRFDDGFIESERDVARLVVDGRRDGFNDAVEATGIVEDPRFFDFDRHWEMMRHQYAPFIESTFRFDASYVRRGMELNSPGNPNLIRLRIPPAWIWLQRLQWGLHAVLARLQAEGDFRDVFREQLDAPLDRPEGNSVDGNP